MISLSRISCLFLSQPLLELSIGHIGSFSTIADSLQPRWRRLRSHAARRRATFRLMLDKRAPVEFPTTVAVNQNLLRIRRGLARLLAPFLFAAIPAYAQNEIVEPPYDGAPLAILECSGHNFTWGSVPIVHTVIIYPDAATFDGWWYSLSMTDDQYTLYQLPAAKQTTESLARPKTITINRITGTYYIPAGAVTEIDLSLPGDKGCTKVRRKF